MSCFIIAEMANAHEGNLETAVAIVNAAAKAGADAIKFQVFTAEELAVPSYTHFGLYKKLEMQKQDWSHLIEKARDLKLKIYADVFGIESAELMETFRIDGFMIHAADILNKPLLKKVGSFGRNLILSLAGSNWPEVMEAVSTVKSVGNSSILLMHGFQGYPTVFADSHLNKIRLIQDKFNLPVGFASHVDGASPEATYLPILAVCAGASTIEVHITLDRSKKGLDYYSSLEIDQFAYMVNQLRKTELALGSPSLDITESELKYRLGHRKHLIVTRDMKPGEIIQMEDIAFKRIDNPPIDSVLDLDSVIGSSLTTTISRYSPIRLENILRKVCTQ